MIHKPNQSRVFFPLLIIVFFVCMGGLTFISRSNADADTVNAANIFTGTGETKYINSLDPAALLPTPTPPPVLYKITGSRSFTRRSLIPGGTISHTLNCPVEQCPATPSATPGYDLTISDGDRGASLTGGVITNGINESTISGRFTSFINVTQTAAARIVTIDGSTTQTVEIYVRGSAGTPYSLTQTISGNMYAHGPIADNACDAGIDAIGVRHFETPNELPYNDSPPTIHGTTAGTPIFPLTDHPDIPYYRVYGRQMSSFANARPGTANGLYDAKADANYSITTRNEACEITSVDFEEIDSPVDVNPDSEVPGSGRLGVGKRIFPDKPSQNGNLNYKRVRVKAVTTCTIAPKTVFFQSFDVDDPSSSSFPLDLNSFELGGDNRDSIFPKGSFGAGSLPYKTSATTDADGVATVYFEVGMSPGDNYKIGASFNQADLDGIHESTDSTLNEDNSRDMLAGSVKLTAKLYVWRRMHVEVDSMGIIQSNHAGGIVESIKVGSSGRYSLVKVCPNSFCPSQTIFSDYQFENGKFVANGKSYKVKRNIGNTLIIETGGAPRFLPGSAFALYDDDNVSGNGNGDEGYDIQRPDLSLIQDSDAPENNIYAHAYIRPEYNALINYTTEDVQVAVNDENTFAQIDLGLESASDERDDFWVVYIQGAYQGASTNDWDPNGEAGSPSGLTRTGVTNNDPNTAPSGGIGTVIFAETIRDKRNSTEVQATAHPGGAPAHEIGHQFGLAGDNCLDARVDPRALVCQNPGGIDYGIMSYGSTSYFFKPIHLSKLRSRICSPGTCDGNSQIGPSSLPIDLSYPVAKSFEHEELNTTLAKKTPNIPNQILLVGDLDQTFDSDGKVTTELNSGNDDFAYAVTIQPDGKIIVVGDTDNGTNTDFGVVRYNTNGSLDTSFGSGGKATIPFGTGFDFVNSVAVQSDGKIILAGYTETAANNIDFALIRLESNGIPDPTFGINGKVTTDIGGIEDRIIGLVLQSDGKIIAAGSTDNGVQADVALARYNSDGTLDTSFDTDGIVVTSFSNLDEFSSDVAVQSDGKIVITGESENGANTDFFTARYQTNGILDTTFGTNGKTVTDFSNSDDGATSLVIQTDGKLIVGGYSGNLLMPDFALARYNADGTLDAAFGTNGKVITDFVGDADFVNDIALRGNGTIIAVGHSYTATNSDLAVAQYLSTGTLDTTFGTSGKVMTPIGTSDDFGIATAIQPDNKIVVAGASFNGTTDDFAVARYLFTSPTAASVSISGRVVNPSGIGIGRASVTIVNSNGTLNKTAITNAFGYYRFEDIPVGETSIITVRHKRFSFTPQVLNVFESREDVNFTGEP